MSESDAKPESVEELLPKRLYLAELLTLPLFWFAPLMLAVLGGLGYLDAERIEEMFGVEFDKRRYLYLFTPFVLAQLGSVLYRTRRRRMFRRHLGLSLTAFGRHVRGLGIPRAIPVRAWCLLLLLGVVGVLVAPDSVLGTAFLALLAGNVVVAPSAVLWDLRKLAAVEPLPWSRLRYVHVLVSAIPFGIFVYVVQRDEHAHYAAILAAWDVDPETLAVPEAERSLLERWIA